MDFILRIVSVRFGTISAPRPCRIVLLQLPSGLVITSIVQELTAIAESTKSSLLEILANIRLVVPAHGGSQMGWGTNRTLAHHSRAGITGGCVFLLEELRIVIHAAVDLVVGFALLLLVDLNAFLEDRLSVSVDLRVHFVDGRCTLIASTDQRGRFVGTIRDADFATGTRILVVIRVGRVRGIVLGGFARLEMRTGLDVRIDFLRTILGADDGGFMFTG